MVESDTVTQKPRLRADPEPRQEPEKNGVPGLSFRA